MMQPIIGVTAGETINQRFPFAPPVQGQAHTYIDAVIHAGGAPFIVPLAKNNEILRRLYDQCTGILLSGGNDLDPGLYGQKPTKYTEDFSKDRDTQELQLLAWALTDDKPVLAICRGMQLLNVAQGGSLYQHIPDDLPEAAVHNIASEKKRESRVVHNLQLSPNSKLAAIMQAEAVGTNAYHHQAIKNLGKDLVVTARAEDGIIEAVELPDKNFVIGVQSHPESLEAAVEPAWRKLFEAFVAAAAVKQP